MDLTVVIMVYDEIATLRPTCVEIGAVLDRCGMAAEVLIVDDGSRDGTAALADDLAREDARIRVIHHATNRGLGGVYRTGFMASRGKYLTFFPADGQFPASIIADFLPRMDSNDLILGYLPARPRSLLGRLLSRAERLLYAALFGPMPEFQGIMLIRTARLHELRLYSRGRGWAVVMELILRARREGWRIVSIPTAVRPRRHGHSKVNNAKTVVANLVQLWKLNRSLAAQTRSDTRGLSEPKMTQLSGNNRERAS